MILTGTGMMGSQQVNLQYGLVAVAHSPLGANRTTSIITTSLDAVNWTTRSVSYDDGIGNFLNDVAWKSGGGYPNQWVAVSQYRPGFPGTSHKIFTSPDSITWTPREFPSSGGNKLALNTVIVAKDKFYAGGGGNVSVLGYNIIQSADGETWTTSGGLTTGNHSVSGIAYSPTLDRAFGSLNSDTDRGQRSTNADLSSWVISSNLDFEGVKNATIWIPELDRFLQVGAGTYANYSSTALSGSWSQVATPDGATYTGLAWSPTLARVVAVASTGSNRVMYSSNGTSWSNAGVSGASGRNWQGVTWSPQLNLFVAVGDAGWTMHSADGIAWTQVQSSLTGTGLTAKDLKGISWGLIGV